MTTIRSLLAAALAPLALAGCTVSGPIQARITRPENGGAVTMRFRTDRFTDNGTITATLPSGEQYTGRFLQVTSDTDAAALDPFWGDWGVGWAGSGPWDDDVSDAYIGADIPTFIRNYSGKVIATLLGNQGGRMRCRFRLAEPEQGMQGGGLGQCQTGSGERIDATF